jgi:hypothetical protein
VAQREGFPFIYHLLHMANLRSVAEHGLLSRREVDARGIGISSLQSEEVRTARAALLTLPDGSAVPLDHYLTFRWFPSTPVLANKAYDWREGKYSQANQEFLVLLEVDTSALEMARELWFATAPPFSRECSLVAADGFGQIPWDRLRTARDHHGDFSDVISRSEILVGNVVAPSYLHACVVCDEVAADRVRALGSELPVSVRPEWFFGF